MTTISMAQAATSTTEGNRQWKAQPVVHKFLLDLALAATAKGSALANADVIECIRIPAGSIVSWAEIQCIVASAGGTSDQTITLGDGVDPNRWVDTTDWDAMAAGDMGTIVIATSNPTAFATADTVDVAITGGTTIGTSGKYLITALITDVNDNEKVGLAQVAS